MRTKSYLRTGLACLALLPSFVAAQGTPTSLAYVLQADSLASTATQAATIIANCGRDWVVIDASFDGTTPWSPANITTIRQGKPGRKVIAYLSIGEAEDYRPYWQKEWTRRNKPTAAAPSWLGLENPDWKGNYRVKYWQPGWQAIILAAADDIMAQGFDGVYLDIVDGFEFYEQDHRKFIDYRFNPETSQSYRRDMVDWVKTLANHIRIANSNALVIPQNGVQLLENSDFRDVIDAVGVEDLFTNGKKAQSKDDTNYILTFLAAATTATIPVFDIEYAKSTKLRQTVQQSANSQGFVWLLTDRDLKTIGESGQ
ncbi:MAG TPA: MJ1477/TM1410 family putative glycoside hydrolase [Rariglobus sp.]|jgi:cysteinyl-tRNA synthetase|nr:MJ1477/TM1410 family putative glycoside hydrolase [Rariglobus sp.]